MLCLKPFDDKEQNLSEVKASILISYFLCLGCEISDEEAEKIFTVNDAVDLLQKKLDVEA